MTEIKIDVRTVLADRVQLAIEKALGKHMFLKVTPERLQAMKLDVIAALGEVAEVTERVNLATLGSLPPGPPRVIPQGGVLLDRSR